MLSEEYVAQGLLLKARVDRRLYGLVREFDQNPIAEGEEA